ncbi:MAG: hypothetical protein RR971_04385 [Alistipes sp.]
MNKKNTYQAPELNVWSIVAEQGFAASLPTAQGDFQGLGVEDTWTWE